MLFEELMAWDFLSNSPGTTTTNVSGFEFLYWIDIFAFIGFYSVIDYLEPTPKGDFIKWFIWGGFGWQIRFRSISTYPTLEFTKYNEPDEMPCFSGKYSKVSMFGYFWVP